MRNFGKNILMRLIIGGVGFLVLLGIYFFSAQGGADSAYEDFQKNMKDTGQIHVVEEADGSKTTAYILSDDEYGFVFEYDGVKEVLNCSSDNKSYTFMGEDMSGEYDLEGTCTSWKEELDYAYDQTLNLFFGGNYEADYEKKDDHYYVKGDYETGGSYEISLYKDGNKVVWKDNDITYSIEIDKDVKIPTE